MSPDGSLECAAHGHLHPLRRLDPCGRRSCADVARRPGTARPQARCAGRRRAAALGLHDQHARAARHTGGASRRGPAQRARQHRAPHPGAARRPLQPARLAAGESSAAARGGRARPQARRACVRLLPLPERPGPARELVARRPAGRLHRAADGRHARRPQAQRRPQHAAAGGDARHREGEHRGGGSRRRRVLRVVRLQKVDSRGRDAHGGEDADRRRCVRADRW